MCVTVCLLFDAAELNVRLVIERPLTEISILEEGIHIEAAGAKMVGAWNVGNDAFPVSAHARLPHPHIPVPHLHIIQHNSFF